MSRRIRTVQRSFDTRLRSLAIRDKILRSIRLCAPIGIALTVSGIAHAQGTMDFSGAQTLMGTFKTFAMYAGAVICLGGLIFAGIRMMTGRFQSVNNAQYADLIEPLMVWLLRRIDDVLYNPANLGVPKHILIEELFSSMKNKQLLEAALASIKTVRKNLGGVTMVGQSAEDLGTNADSIVNSCTSFLFLKDATFNRKRYAELFKLNEQQIALFESLEDREALYTRRDGLTKVIKLNLDSRSYAAFSTKPKDRVRRTSLIRQYGLNEGIARFAAGEAL